MPKSITIRGLQLHTTDGLVTIRDTYSYPRGSRLRDLTPADALKLAAALTTFAGDARQQLADDTRAAKTKPNLPSPTLSAERAKRTRTKNKRKQSVPTAAQNHTEPDSSG